MLVHNFGKALAAVGGFLMIAGGLTVATIFLIVLVNGSWPDFLSPIQNAARTTSEWIGDLVWLVWIAVFIGPGVVVQAIGQSLQSKR